MFHLKDDVFLEALPFGDVRIVKTDGKEPTLTNVQYETVLTRSVLASIMAYCCKRGYTTHTFYEAYDFLQHPEMAEKAPEMTPTEPSDGE